MCSPTKSYIITGGLGGFGMAVAEFLNWHGAKNIVITSKRGVRNGSQEAALQELWFSKINVRSQSCLLHVPQGMQSAASLASQQHLAVFRLATCSRQ